eukprot:5227556-Pyramimonas_sp.AAC.1
MGDRAVQYSGLLANVAVEHHERYVSVYGLGVVKSKIHYVHHSILNLPRLRVNVSCFACERKHKDCKAIAQRCTTEQATPHIIDLVLCELEENLKDVNTFVPEYIDGAATPQPQLRHLFQTISPRVGPAICTCSVVQTRIGTVKAGDFVQCSHNGHNHHGL